MSSSRDVFNRYRDAFTRGGPMPGGALAEIAWSESHGDPSAIARGNIPRSGPEPRNAFVEGGMLQERVAKSEDDYPHRFNVDPMTAAGAIWLRQKSIDHARRGLDVLLRHAGFRSTGASSVPDAIVAMGMPHSIGQGAFRKVLELAGPANGRTLSEALREWTATPESSLTHPEYGSQTGVKVRARVVRLVGLPRRAAALEPLPAQLQPLADRPSDVHPVPAGLYQRIKGALP